MKSVTIWEKEKEDAIRVVHKMAAEMGINNTFVVHPDGDGYRLMDYDPVYAMNFEEIQAIDKHIRHSKFFSIKVNASSVVKKYYKSKGFKVTKNRISWGIGKSMKKLREHYLKTCDEYEMHPHYGMFFTPDLDSLLLPKKCPEWDLEG
jgi:hypothetical protein